MLKLDVVKFKVSAITANMLLFLLFLFSYLPQRILFVLGKFVGLCLFIVVPRRSAIIKRNLSLCFPAATKEKLYQYHAEVTRNIGIGLFESAVACWRSDRYIRSKSVVVGLENLQDAVSTAKGVILLCPHYTMMMIVIRICAMHVPLYLLHRLQNNAFVENMLSAAREKFLAGAVAQHDVRKIIQIVRANKVLLLLPDHDLGRIGTVFAKFFGVEAATVTSISKLAAINGAAVLPLSCMRESSGKYKLSFGKALDDFPSGSLAVDAARVNQVIAESLEGCITQYYWVHRRFKTRPIGEKEIY